MSKLKLVALFAVVAGGLTVAYRRLTAGDDVWQSVTDPVDGPNPTGGGTANDVANDAPVDSMVQEATPAVQEDWDATQGSSGTDPDIERGVGEGLPAEDPFEGRVADPLTDPLPEDE